MTGKCKDCRFASFDAGDVPGSFKWSGICLVDMLTRDVTGTPKYHTIMQHFNCSCNRFEPRGGGQR